MEDILDKFIEITHGNGHENYTYELKSVRKNLQSDDPVVRLSAARNLADMCHVRALGDINVKGYTETEWWGLLDKLGRYAREKIEHNSRQKRNYDIKNHLHSKIAREIGPLLDELALLGYVISGNHYSPEAGGNFTVDFKGISFSFRIVKDQGQYAVDGERDVLEKAGLRRNFKNLGEFQGALLTWLKQKNNDKE